jgi:hypothetical protein
MTSAGISTNEGYQIPTISNVADAILVPTIIRVKSLSSYCLNSLTILSKRNTHTTRTETAN